MLAAGSFLLWGLSKAFTDAVTNVKFKNQTILI